MTNPNRIARRLEALEKSMAAPENAPQLTFVLDYIEAADGYPTDRSLPTCAADDGQREGDQARHSDPTRIKPALKSE